MSSPSSPMTNTPTPSERAIAEASCLPCPFCGGQPHLDSTDPTDPDWCTYWLECTDCHAESPPKALESLAIAAWNRRDAGREEAACDPSQPQPCNKHPDAPHGFDRTSSHSLGRYVCDCEGWEPPSPTPEAVRELVGKWRLDATTTRRAVAVMRADNPQSVSAAAYEKIAERAERDADELDRALTGGDKQGDEA